MQGSVSGSELGLTPNSSEDWSQMVRVKVCNKVMGDAVSPSNHAEFACLH